MNTQQAIRILGARIRARQPKLSTREALAIVGAQIKPKAPAVKNSNARDLEVAELVVRGQTIQLIEAQIQAAGLSLHATAPAPKWVSNVEYSVPVLTPEQARARLAAKGGAK